ncbi:MAG: preprotein translocase subunit SecG [Candidatus Neomarinimicrobiota bacterium]|jgi:preprotein translocase subunit SecG|nr:MAG: preprotein translocase subunit SecG [Candidatus Neomarinimicrobiota bacterium]
MLYGIAIFIFVLVCFMLMGIILLQSSKTGGMGTAMGGQAINTAFGGHGADKLLVKITSGLAVAFMVLAITIGMMDNPASRIDFSNKPTLSRNEGAGNTVPAPAVDLQPVEKAVPVEIPTGNDGE